MTMGINHEPALNWWVPHVLRKCDRIISGVAKAVISLRNSRVRRYAVEHEGTFFLRWRLLRICGFRRVFVATQTANTRVRTPPPPKNVERHIYEYIDRKNKDTFFSTNLL